MNQQVHPFQIMIDQIGEKLFKGKFETSTFNYYTTRFERQSEDDPNAAILWWADTNVNSPVNPTWKQAKSNWLDSVPCLQVLMVRHETVTMISEKSW